MPRLVSRWFVRDVWDSIRTQPSRFGLAFLAIAIGVMALTILLAIVGGLQARADRMVEDLGADTIALVQSGRVGEAAMDRGLVARLRAELPASEVSGVARYALRSPFGDGQIDLWGVDEYLPATRPWPLREGRMLDAEDVRRSQPHVVVGGRFSKDVDPRPGHVLPLRAVPVRVVGLLALDRGSGAAEGRASQLLPAGAFVLAPWTVASSWREDASAERGRCDLVFIKAGGARESVMAVVARLLAAEPGLAERVHVVTPEALTAAVRRIERMIKIGCGSIALLCLVLGGSTLMSLMTANVRERVTEIGLRMAIGASERDVFLLFAGESLLVSVAASLGGLALSVLLLSMIGGNDVLPVALRPATIVTPLLAAAVTGLVATVLPALTASRMAPTEALRYE